MGALPSAVTSAEPLWIPFRVRAGKGVDADPRETHFAELRRLTFDGNAGQPVWGADGARILAADAASCRGIATIDLASGDVTRPAEPYAAPINSFAGAGETQARCKAADSEVSPCWPAAALVARTATLLSDTFACDVYVGNKQVAAGYGLTATADGSRIAFVQKSKAGLELFAAASDGSGAARVAEVADVNVAPRFSPDGTSLAWAHRGKEGELHVWLAGANGARPRQVTQGGKNDTQPAFFPDSRQLIYASDRDSTGSPPKFSLYRIDPEAPATAGGGAHVERITFAEGVDAAPVFSPDGKWLAFLSSRAGQGMDLYVARWRD
jgi:TolB protein